MIPVNPADCVPGEELWPESSRTGSKHNNSLLRRETLYSSYWEADLPVLCSHEKLCWEFQGCSLHKYLWIDSLPQKPIITSICKICSGWEALELAWDPWRMVSYSHEYMKTNPIQVTEYSAIFKMSKLAELLDNQTWVSCCFNKLLQ